MNHDEGARCLWVTNTPTPYRTHLFRALDAAFRQRNIRFQVAFMAETEPWRNWPLEQMSFEHRVAFGLHPRISTGIAHLNPEVPLSLLTRPPEWLILGGAWCMPTVLLSLVAAAARRRSKCAFWSEANRHSIEHDRGHIARLRRSVFRHVDTFVVPGRVAVDTIQELRGQRPASFLTLPNLVDEELFRSRVEELRARRDELRAREGFGPRDRVVLWSARLEERTKGIMNFLRSVHGSFPEGLTILIAGGEGDDSAPIRAFVARELPGRVRLLGHCDTPRMLELMALSDASMLPSLRDANPLSVVEALWAALPVLVSSHCGNAPEAVEPGANGWLVDPLHAESMRIGFAQLARCSLEELANRGQHSRRLASERFSTGRAVSEFADRFQTW